MRGHRVDHVVDLAAVTRVHGDSRHGRVGMVRCDGGRDLFGASLVDVGDDDRRPAGCQPPRDGLADALPGRGGDKCDLSGEFRSVT